MSSRQTFRHGCVASAHPLASAAGVKVLKAGGNAVDAAVATSLALGVVAPAFSGIGGGGFLMVHLHGGDTLYIDYRETAPRRAEPDMFELGPDGEALDFANSMGYRAVAVPGTIAGLSYALENYGNLRFGEVASYAIDYAKRGFEISNFVGTIMSNNVDNAVQKFRRHPETAREWMKGGRTYRKGEKKVSPAFGRMLEQVSREGPDAFYRSDFAKALAAEMAKNGGIIDGKDLATYAPKVRKPVKGTYRGYDVHAMPPPSLGGTAIIQMLNILEDTDVGGTGLNTAETIGTMAKALGVVWADLRRQLADPDYVKIDQEKLTSKDYAARLWFNRGERGATRDGTGGSKTTHMSVIDKDRNVAAITESIECYFGSGVTIPGYGFLLNDTMHDFDAAPGTVNSIQPGKRPRSNMTPTLLLKEGEPFLVAGSAAGPRIVTATLQTIINVVDHSLGVQEAVDAPRFHYSGSGSLKVESRVRPGVRKQLGQMGFETEEPNYLQLKPGYDVYFGGVHAIQVGKRGGLVGAADSRRQGGVAGY